MNAPATAVAEIAPKRRQRKAVTVRQEQAPTSLLQVIERAARDPSVDIVKMERLIELQRQIHDREAESLFNIAMAEAQSEMTRVAADANNPQTHSRYATYAAIDRVLRPVYTKHGFALSFDEADSPKAEHIRVLCHVSHRGGFTRTYHTDMPADGKGAKGGDVMTKTHAAGSAKSYGMRYLVRGIFNVAVGEDDDDGNGAGVPVLSEGQQADLQAMVEERGFTLASFLKWAKVDTLAQIPAANYLTCVQAIKARGYAR